MFDKIATSPKKIIQRSNRPFIDERTPEDIKAYKKYCIEREKELTRDADRVEYYKILSLYPDKAPKSFGSYRTMKRKKTKNYQLLVEFLKEHNFYI